MALKTTFTMFADDANIFFKDSFIGLGPGQHLNELTDLSGNSVITPVNGTAAFEYNPGDSATIDTHTLIGTVVQDGGDSYQIELKVNVIGTLGVATGNADVLVSSRTETADIAGGKGDDVIYLRAGGIAKGDAGKDTIIATGNAFAKIAGGADDDILKLGAGGGEAYGGTGNDKISGGTSSTGSSLLRGDDGDDELFAINGTNRMEGGAGNDTLVSGKGNDLMLGGIGNDTYKFLGSFGTDRADFRDGSDTAIFSSSATGTVTIVGFDFTNGPGADHIYLDGNEVATSTLLSLMDANNTITYMGITANFEAPIFGVPV